MPVVIYIAGAEIVVFITDVDGEAVLDFEDDVGRAELLAGHEDRLYESVGVFVYLYEGLLEGLVIEEIALSKL